MTLKSRFSVACSLLRYTTTPCLCCYTIFLSHRYNLAHFLDRGLVKPPLFVQSIFGILGGIGADPENVTHMRRIADKLFDDQYIWSVRADGRHQVTMSAVMGDKP